MTDQSRSVVVYERVSSDKQDITRQAVQRDRAAIEYPGRETMVLQDDGVSAYKIPIFDRPAGKRLCELVETGQVEAIFVDAQDRLSRGRQSEWWNFVDLCQSNRTRIVIDGRELKLDDEGDEIKSALDAILARRESREKAHRITGGLAKVVASGRYLGSRRPYGWDFDGERQHRRLILNPAEATTIRRMVEWYESGAGDADIAGRLNASGVPSPSGGEWEKSEIRNILTSPLIKGFVHRRTPQGRQEFEGQHQAIVDPARWDQLQEIRASRRGRGRRPEGGHVFTGGILRCPECHSALRARTTPRGYAYYECTGRYRKDRPVNCVQSNINARHIEEAILGGLLRRIFDLEETAARIEQAAERERQRAGSLLREAERQIAAVEKKRQRAQRDYLDGKLSAQLWADASAALDRDTAMADAHAAELREAAASIEDEARDIDAQRVVVDRLHALQQLIAGQPEEDHHLDVIRQALHQTFECIHLAPGPNEELVVIPVPRRTAVIGDGGPIEIELRGGEIVRTQAQVIRREPLPAALTKGRAPT